MTSKSAPASIQNAEKNVSPWSVFLIFLYLGCTCFGGPAAHLGYFREEFVVRRRWLSERSYADLVALCQFLPGAASSQLGMALGLLRAGYAGALAAWAGFTLPSALALTLFALGINSYGDVMASGVFQGLKIVAVSVVAQAVWGMAVRLCTDASRIFIMAIAACTVLLVPNIWGQVGVIIAAGAGGLLMLKPVLAIEHDPLPITVSRRAGLGWIALFFVLLTGLPVMAYLLPEQIIQMVDAFYRTGALVFGGGHVVLPLLHAEVIPSGWIGNETFLAGYSAAQAVPGPLFTFAAFLGTAMNTAIAGWISGVVCLLAIFIPSFLLIIGALPFWEKLRRNLRMQAALTGINAAVVGLLLAALYQPIWTSTIHQPPDFIFALIALIALMFWKLPTWFVVISSGFIGWLLNIAGVIY